MGLMNKPIKIIPLKGTVALTVPLTFGDLFAVIMPVYNELVRDRIPAIIQESGKNVEQEFYMIVNIYEN